MEEKKSFIQRIIGAKVKLIIFIVLVVVVVVALVGLLTSKERTIKITVKTKLDELVEKSNLETINITYNVIAKQCKEDEECDKTSNKIEDFDYVVSCSGTITAGINFKEVKIDVQDKKIIIDIPDASVLGEPTIGTLKFLNGKDVPAEELPRARKLCQETIKQKSSADDHLIPYAKDQAKVVLLEFYKPFIKTYDSSYELDVR